MELPTKKSEPVKDLRKYIFQLFGSPKAGKSTFASHFKNAVFICTEPGTKFLSVYGGDHVHKDWEDIRDTVRNLCTKDHQFETVVFDTIDNAFELCSRYVCKKEGIEHESDLGFGKGWSAVKKEFKQIIDALANRGFGIVFLSHVKTEEREQRGIKRPYINNSLPASAKTYINGLCDFIFYCFIDDDGNRLMRTKSNINTDAGDRSGILPEVMPMSYDLLESELLKKWQPTKEEARPKRKEPEATA